MLNVRPRRGQPAADPVGIMPNVQRPAWLDAGAALTGAVGQLEQGSDYLLGRSAMLALEAGAVPFLVLKADCHIVYISHPASVLLHAGRAFAIRNNRLVIRRRNEYTAVKQAIVQAIEKPAAVMIRLYNRQGDVNHLVTIKSIPQSDLVFLLVAELRGKTLLPPGWTQEALDLPAHLAELAEGLAEGETLSEFAARTGLTFEGTRTRLRKLLERTATRSQMDLTNLLHRAAAVVLVPHSLD